jgi:hypothetical protein
MSGCTRENFLHFLKNILKYNFYAFFIIGSYAPASQNNTSVLGRLLVAIYLLFNSLALDQSQVLVLFTYFV